MLHKKALMGAEIGLAVCWRG